MYALYFIICMCVCVNGVFRDCVSHGVLASETILASENMPPRTFSISTLHGRIAFRRSLAKFGQRPLNTCFIRCVFNPALKTTDYSAKKRVAVTSRTTIHTPLTHCPPQSVARFKLSGRHTFSDERIQCLVDPCIPRIKYDKNAIKWV